MVITEQELISYTYLGSHTYLRQLGERVDEERLMNKSMEKFNSWATKRSALKNFKVVSSERIIYADLLYHIVTYTYED